jgi:ligand-binding SRPBCC domain-containing protein
MAFYIFKRAQKINGSIEEIWDFISSPENLKKITPAQMGFNITSGNLPVKMYPGMMIGYKVSPFPGIRMNWLTEITHVEYLKFFVDEQRVGPYKIWHHEHHLIPIKNGVLMQDIICYSPPFGFLGRIANFLFIRRKLEQIFSFRKLKLEEIFGKYT